VRIGFLDEFDAELVRYGGSCKGTANGDSNAADWFGAGEFYGVGEEVDEDSVCPVSIFTFAVEVRIIV